MPDSVYFEIDGFSNIVADQLECRVTNLVLDINFSAGEVVV